MESQSANMSLRHYDLAGLVRYYLGPEKERLVTAEAGYQSVFREPTCVRRITALFRALLRE